MIKKETATSKNIKMAIVLAAGQGSRLRPLTESMPKSLIPIGGITVLEHLLQALCSLGIDYVVLVVGYLGKSIRREIGSNYQGMQIHYVENSLYENSETMMSLWCAREFFYSDLLLVEGNIIIEPVIVHDLIACSHKNAMVVTMREPAYQSGTLVSIGDKGLVDRMLVSRDEQKDIDLNYMYRTVNVYKLASDFLHEQLKPRLKLYLNLGLTKDYYQILIRDFVAEGTVHFAPVFIGQHQCITIDTPEDLDRANRMFAASSEFCTSKG